MPPLSTLRTNIKNLCKKGLLIFSQKIILYAPFNCKRMMSALRRETNTPHRVPYFVRTLPKPGVRNGLDLEINRNQRGDPAFSRNWETSTSCRSSPFAFYTDHLLDNSFSTIENAGRRLLENAGNAE